METNLKRKVYELNMEDFLKITPVFCQRDENPRLAGVAKLLRNNPVPTQHEVSIGKYPDGKLVVLDGNTRAEIWRKNGRPLNRIERRKYGVDVPNILQISEYPIIDEGDGPDEYAKKLYYTFDSQKSVETSKHKLTGIHRALGLNFDSRKLAQGMYSKGLEYTIKEDPLFENKKDMWGAVNIYQKELKLLDSIGIGVTFSQSHIAASLMLLKINGDNPRLKKALSYIKSGYDDGSDPNHGKCPIAVLREEYRSQDPQFIKKGTSGYEMSMNISFIIFCIEKFMTRERLKINPVSNTISKRSVKKWDKRYNHFFDMDEDDMDE